MAGETGLEIGFGRAREGAVASASRLMGQTPSETASLQDCGAGPMMAVRFDRGLTMMFQEGAFAGWAARGTANPPLRLPSGLSTASTRAEITSRPGTAFRATTLGEEFSSAGVSGIVGADGRVALLWSGVSCFAR